MRYTPFALALLASLALDVGAGPVYKWVDAAGQTHYGEVPPSDQTAALQPKPQPGASWAPPAKPASPAAAKLAESKPVESKAAKAGRCAAAQARIAFLEEKTARRLFVLQVDGSEARMTEEEFEVQLNKAKAAATESCGQ